jgi:hypothetical protein
MMYSPALIWYPVSPSPRRDPFPIFRMMATMTIKMTSAIEGRNQKGFDGLLEFIYKNFHYNPRPLWERAGRGCWK